MKPNYFTKRVFAVVGIAFVSLLHALQAATFTAPYHFTGGCDGANSKAGVVVSGNTIYGTANGGGCSNWGSVFRVRTDGGGFVTLHSFTNVPDGAYPRAGVTLSSNVLYGTTEYGGTYTNGTVFKVTTNGTGYTVLHSFGGGQDGANPYGGVVLSGNTLYGTAHFGGDLGFGTIFKLDTDGKNFTTLHTFSYYGSDGGSPSAGLVMSGGTLYGTAAGGGDGGYGTVFKLNTNGSLFTVLLPFRYFDYGGGPRALVVSGDTIYGVTPAGYGTVFKVTTNGNYRTNLRAFTAADGGTPQGVIVVGNTLYGTTLYSADAGHGTVFSMDTAGNHFSTLYNFEPGSYNSQGIITNSDGSMPYSLLTLSGNVLYGTTFQGGINGSGTVFTLRLPDPVPLTAQTINNALVLSWTNAAFSLQRSSTVDGTYADIPGATTPYTNTTTVNGMFFRLRLN
jgi:uncharacterized repeat protein (TIGR03803 family)